MHQPPTSPSSDMNSMPLLQAAELLPDNNFQIPIQQQQQIQSASDTGGNGSGAAAFVVSRGLVLLTIDTSDDPSPASTSAGSNLVMIRPPQLGTQVGNNNDAVGNCSWSLGSSEPPAKKRMLDHSSTSNNVDHLETLEDRLEVILRCSVCLELSKKPMYQCQLGHLMCVTCFAHLLADARLRDQIATCPICRVEISRSTTSRNSAVEKATSELRGICQFCKEEFLYKSLEHHEQHDCQERPTNCKYSRIGCTWLGPIHESTQHECNCEQPNKSGYELMAALELYNAPLMEERKMFNTLIDLLNYERIIFNDLRMKPYRTNEYVHKLFYETARFTAFNQQWVVKARVNDSQRDPHESIERKLAYQVILKTKTVAPLRIYFFALKGPFSDMKLSTRIYRHNFSDQTTESDYHVLPLPDSPECNRLLSNKGINLRLLMFLVNK